MSFLIAFTCKKLTYCLISQWQPSALVVAHNAVECTYHKSQLFYSAKSEINYQIVKKKPQGQFYSSFVKDDTS